MRTRRGAFHLKRLIPALALVAPGIAFAQSVADVPPGTLPSREETSPPPPPAAAQAGVSVDARAATGISACPFTDSPLTFTLTGVTYVRPDGSPVAPELALSLAEAGASPGTYPLAKICELRDRAGEALRRDGWVASVQVPPQSIEDGAVRLTVISAHITDMRVRGEPGPFRALLEERIARLKALDPLNERDAERILLLAGDVPGLDVQLSLRPAGTVPGEVIGELAIDYDRFAVIANAQNYNSKRLGRETGYVRGEVYGLTGLSDLTFVAVSGTADLQEQLIGQIGHQFALDGRGTTVAGQFTYARSRPDLETLDLQTDTLIGNLDLRYPLVRSVRANLDLTAGFDLIDQKTVLRAGGGNVPLSLDKIRAASLRLSGNLRDYYLDGRPRFSVEGEAEVRRGVALLGATRRGALSAPLPSRLEGNAQATIVRATLDTSFDLGRVVNVYGRAQGQWTNSPLLNYDEYSIGNLTVGRGYDPGSNSGDRAIALRGELRANIPVDARVGTQLFGFYDHVKLRNLDSNSTEERRTLRSWGGGARVVLPRAGQLEVIYAHPMDRALTLDAAPPPDRVLVSLTLQFRG